ncbi:DUF3857 domain-containing protein [Sphingobacterium oryzagri]|uniref:DUF3857 domain-containing protein n=1 Tax=Sphingobacterium oryzagri TaxID=3025669 RepID=A0ABY7WEA6_9SPHI|nr:DUF3857 domain-containing protein [Sphingobacterium sp. KACC 22765]WDF67538.1 DUF3857 domain-containing protein [Sphingobacterium sp. KACC 22765]
MKYKLFAVVGLLLFCQLHVAYALVPKLTKAATPSWVRPTQKQVRTPDLADVSDGYYYESIDYQVNLGLQTRFYRDVKVLSDHAGAENAGQVNIVFDPQYQSLILHELVVLREGKRLDRLALARFNLMASETDLARSIYNGTYAAHLVLDDLRKDDKIILAYSLKGFNPVFENKFFDSYFLEGSEPIGLLHVHYLVPEGRKLRFKRFVGAAQPAQQAVGNAVSYYWEIAGTGQTAYETNVPYWYTSRPWIQCSEFATWAEVSAWAMRVNPIPVISPSGKLAKFADNLWEKNGRDSLKYVEAVTNFVQNDVRYMGIEVGEYSHRANAPEKVFAQRYGDCKDKSVLLAAILKHKGIESQLVLANTLEEYGLENYQPTPGAFNHMLVFVSVDDRLEKIDPTMSNQGGSFHDRYFPFYGKVLPVGKHGKMQDTDKSVSGTIRVEEKLQLKTDGGATFDVRTIYSGSDADRMRNYFRQTAKNQIEKSYLTYYQGIYKQLDRLAPLTFTDDLRTNVLCVDEHYTIKSLAEVEVGTNRPYVSVYATNILNYLPEATASRTSPIALSYPLSIEHDIYVINPDAVDVPVFGENHFMDRESYYFAKNVHTVKDTLKIAYRLGFHETYVKADNVSEYYADFADKDAYFGAVVYLDGDGFITGSNQQQAIYAFVIIGFILTFALLTWLVHRFYHQRSASSIVPLYDEVQHDQIGGWLIVLLIGLLLSALMVFVDGIKLFFDDLVWSSLEFNHGTPPVFFKGLIFFEFFGNIFLLFLLLYSAYLLVCRRDIFPQTLLFTLLFRLLFLVLDTALSYAMFHQPFDSVDIYSTAIRGLTFSIVWTLYIFNSTRVKGTFLVRSQSQQAREQFEAAKLPPVPALPPLPQAQDDRTDPEINEHPNNKPNDA